MRAFPLFTAAALTLAATLALGGPASADTKAGFDAWERGDYKTAVDIWRTEAAKGDADAQFNLGQAYKMGRGVPVDIEKAEDYYRQAAEKGHDKAADYYGLTLFQNGKQREAAPYLEKAAARGEPRAQYLYGTMLFNGTDVKKDWVRAYALLLQSRRAGLPQADATIKQMDGYIPADQRQQGAAMAARMTFPSIPTGEVADGPRGDARTTDLPPSQVAAQPPRTRPPVVAPPAPPPPPRQQVRPVTPPPTAVRGGSWRVQLGAFGDAGNAQRLGAQLGGRFAGRSVEYVRAGSLTRVLVGPYSSRAEAQAACGTVRPCVPVAR